MRNKRIPSKYRFFVLPSPPRTPRVAPPALGSPSRRRWPSAWPRGRRGRGRAGGAARPRRRRTGRSPHRRPVFNRVKTHHSHTKIAGNFKNNRVENYKAEVTTNAWETHLPRSALAAALVALAIPGRRGRYVGVPVVLLLLLSAPSITAAAAVAAAVPLRVFVRDGDAVAGHAGEALLVWKRKQGFLLNFNN